MSKTMENRPLDIVKYLLNNDPFSQWMGVELLEASEGFCKISCTVRHEMLNGFNVTHGGIIFSLADSALAFSAATFGRVSLSIDNSVSFVKKSETDEKLTATSRCINLTHKTGIFEVEVKNSSDELIALMKSTVYRTSEEFPV
ncbi:MAG: hotdog fold thioesterase [Balneolaceae bacterium]